MSNQCRQVRGAWRRRWCQYKATHSLSPMVLSASPDQICVSSSGERHSFMSSASTSEGDWGISTGLGSICVISSEVAATVVCLLSRQKVWVMVPLLAVVELVMIATWRRLAVVCQTVLSLENGLGAKPVEVTLTDCWFASVFSVVVLSRAGSSTDGGMTSLDMSIVLSVKCAEWV